MFHRTYENYYITCFKKDWQESNLQKTVKLSMIDDCEYVLMISSIFDDVMSSILYITAYLPATDNLWWNSKASNSKRKKKKKNSQINIYVSVSYNRVIVFWSFSIIRFLPKCLNDWYKVLYYDRINIDKAWRSISVAFLFFQE